MKFFIPLLILVLTSCVKPITFEKIIVNNSDQTLTVTDKDYTSLHEARVIPPRTTETLVLCGWSRMGARPTRNDVENRFQITTEKVVIKKIEQGDNWTINDEKNHVTCTFTLNPEDIEQ